MEGNRLLDDSPEDDSPGVDELLGGGNEQEEDIDADAVSLSSVEEQQLDYDYELEWDAYNSDGCEAENFPLTTSAAHK